MELDIKTSMSNYIKDHKDGLQHAVDAVELLYCLIRNCAYDVHILKGVIKEMYREDVIIKKNAPQLGRQLEEEYVETLLKINKKLREGSDLWGALTRD